MPSTTDRLGHVIEERINKALNGRLSGIIQQVNQTSTIIDSVLSPSPGTAQSSGGESSTKSSYGIDYTTTPITRNTRFISTEERLNNIDTLLAKLASHDHNGVNSSTLAPSGGSISALIQDVTFFAMPFDPSSPTPVSMYHSEIAIADTTNIVGVTCCAINVLDANGDVVKMSEYTWTECTLTPVCQIDRTNHRLCIDIGIRWTYSHTIYGDTAPLKMSMDVGVLAFGS